MLRPRDGAEKDKGELTGGKRLIQRLHRRHGHFADVIVADALYLNAPFINTVVGCGMDAVIRLKDEKRCIFQDAEGLFRKDMGRKDGFQKGKTSVAVWDLSDFEVKDCERKLRVVKFQETTQGQKESRFVWLVTTLTSTPSEFLWEMMHKRWDIEENAFHPISSSFRSFLYLCIFPFPETEIPVSTGREINFMRHHIRNRRISAGAHCAPCKDRSSSNNSGIKLISANISRSPLTRPSACAILTRDSRAAETPPVLEANRHAYCH